MTFIALDIHNLYNAAHNSYVRGVREIIKIIYQQDESIDEKTDKQMIESHSSLRLLLTNK